MIRIFKNLFRRLRFYLNNSQNKLKHMNNDTNEIKDLRENGITVIQNFIEKDQFIQQIFNYCSDIIKTENFKIKCDEIKEEKKKQTSVKNFKIDITKLFEEKKIFDLANKSSLLNYSDRYFNKKSYLNAVQIWEDTFISDPGPSDTQIFHRDGDNFFLLKCFLYLSEVNFKNGPFEYLKSSHKINDEYSKGELLFKEQNSLVTACGSAGDLVIADTNGYHRGRKLIEGKRHLIMFMFTDKS